MVQAVAQQGTMTDTENAWVGLALFLAIAAVVIVVTTVQARLENRRIRRNGIPARSRRIRY